MAVFDENQRNDSEPDTQVDLGEDLLEKTVTLERLDPLLRPDPGELDPHPAASPQEPPDLADLLHTAKILVNEGLLDEAKKVLRRVLMTDPHHLPARKRLEEIHESELKQILGDTELPRRKRKASSIDSDQVLRELDRDLGLELFPDGDAHSARQRELSLFESREELELFEKKLESDLQAASARDRIDIGIAFFEMGLYEIAIKQFRVAANEETLRLAAQALLAKAQIASGRPLEAIQILSMLLNDESRQPDEKLDLLYQMGRAHEMLADPRSAVPWYRQVREINPLYRDAEDRLKRLLSR